MKLPISRWLLVNQQPSPQVRLSCPSRTDESPSKSATPSPLVASSAARLQNPRAARLLPPRHDGSGQSHAVVGRWSPTPRLVPS